MAWNIYEVKNTVKIDKTLAKRLFAAQEYEQELWHSVEDVRGPAGLLHFSPDHMEHMDYLHLNERVLRVLKRAKVKGTIAFADHEGDSQEKYWGYAFDGKGGLRYLSKKAVLRLLAEEERPPSAVHREFTNERLVDIVDSEGLGYAIQHYVSPEAIDDKALRALWEKAARAMNAIDALLDEVRRARTQEDERDE